MERSGEIEIVGGGLAGCEAAYQLAELGHRVVLREMKPGARSRAHTNPLLAELVCSNSLRSDLPTTASGLLHRELRALGSLLLTAADACRVPCGDALGVDRERFSRFVTERLSSHPLIELREERVRELPEEGRLAILATGPLTEGELGEALGRLCGARFYFYDAIAPILLDASIEKERLFRASRFGQGGGDDYLNIPLDRGQYERFVKELLAGELVPLRAFEEPRFFEGCLPIEVMAARGLDCLAYGPLKPIGLTDPATGERPYAVLQLRCEDEARSAWNLVGCQTRLTWPEQRRIFRSLPGLEHAEFERYGQVHRNTFLDAPYILADDLSLIARGSLFVAGQLAGVEGYSESVACGLLAARFAAARLAGTSFLPPPPSTALGALYSHLRGRARPEGTPMRSIVPSNINYSLFSPLAKRVPKNFRRDALVERASADFARWLASDAGARGALNARSLLPGLQGAGRGG